MSTRPVRPKEAAPRPAANPAPNDTSHPASHPQAAPASPRRRGRPSGPPTGETRDRILAAAREEFSARGYDSTSVRSIARTAGVDPALVHHYFGTKERIFAAAIESSFTSAVGIPEAMVAGGTDGMGERMARFVLGTWEDPVTRGPLLAIVRSAVTNETAAAVFRGMISRTVLGRVAGELDGPDPEFRVQMAASQFVGIIMLRYILKVEPMASAPMDDLVRLVAPTLQRYLTAADVRFEREPGLRPEPQP